ncbi:MAG: response regulator [Polyangiaceae bacterium]
MTGANRYLVVEDEVGIGRHLARLIRKHQGLPVMTRTAAEAANALETHDRWAGFLIDIGLPDGSGLDVLARARVQNPGTPALILTGSVNRDHINSAFDLNAHYVVKPPEGDRLEHFFKESDTFDERLARVALAWQSRYTLSDAELDVLIRFVSGERRADIAAGRDISGLTVKKHVANLLKKTSDPSMPSAVQRVLREMVDS